MMLHALTRMSRRRNSSLQKGDVCSILVSISALLSLTGNPVDAFADGSLNAKRIIEMGWDEPDTGFIRRNVAEMEKVPFDGFVFHILTDAGERFGVDNVWTQRRFRIEQFSNAISDLTTTKFAHLTDRFVRINASPGDVDWFDDVQWGAVLNNFELAAKLAKLGGCKGFMLDVETYKATIFKYDGQKHAATKTFPQYADMVRFRGSELIKAINAQFPDIAIILTYGYKLSGPQSNRLHHSPYGLLASFLDGLLDGAANSTRIVDGWEGSYAYKRKEQFTYAYNQVTLEQRGWSSEPEKYQRLFSVGFGIFMDVYWERYGWNLDDLSKNYFAPRLFSESVRAALEASDKYVWIYSQHPNWWTGERLPREYIEALLEAKVSK